MPESVSHDYGKIDVWGLYSLAETQGVLIDSHDTDCFLHFLFSPSTEKIDMRPTPRNYTVRFLLGGPATEDVEVTPPWSRAVAEGREYTRRIGRLHTDFTLRPSDEQVDEYLSSLPAVIRPFHTPHGGVLKEGDRAAFVERLWELRGNRKRLYWADQIDEVCKLLGLPHG
jgi:hypothetical protein